jgi:hypothetical protein
VASDSIVDLRLRHLADLTRLQQSLAELSQPVPKKDFVRNR